jgi:hypothetical protein
MNRPKAQARMPFPRSSCQTPQIALLVQANTCASSTTTADPSVNSRSIPRAIPAVRTPCGRPSRARCVVRCLSARPYEYVTLKSVDVPRVQLHHWQSRRSTVRPGGTGAVSLRGGRRTLWLGVSGPPGRLMPGTIRQLNSSRGRPAPPVGFQPRADGPAWPQNIPTSSGWQADENNASNFDATILAWVICAA